jgi:uncharacterized protein (TIRG00374 family)
VPLGVAVSLVFTWLAVRGVDLRAVGDALGAMAWGWLAPALAVLAAAVVVRAHRWRLLFPRSRRPPLRAATDALLIGVLFNVILPVRAGDAARVVALHQRAGTSRAEAAGTALTERLYDVLALLVLLFALLPVLPEVTWLRGAGYLAIALVLAAVVTAAVLARYGERPVRWALRPLARLSRVSAATLDAGAASLIRGLDGLRNPRLAARVFAVTVGSWLVIAASTWVLMRGFGLGLGFGAALLVVIATNLAMVLPSAPAAIGVYEAAVLLALRPYGVDGAEALSYALVLHALNFLPYLPAGWLALHGQARAARRGQAAAGRTERLVTAGRAQEAETRRTAPLP